jgi:lipid A 3-O-deacylase
MRILRLVKLFPVVAAAALAASPARAQLRVTVDNDLFGPRGADAKPPDYEYTHGTRVEAVVGRARWWAAPLGVAGRECRNAAPGERCLRTRVEAGQRIYTPRRDTAEPLPGERPYAGWLYGAVAAEEVRPGRARSVGVEAGVTGPPSLAEPVQTGLHRLAGYRAPLGWAHQLRFEPAFALRYAESRVVVATEPGARFAAGVAPEWDATVGTLRTAAGAGVRAGFGIGARPELAGSADGRPEAYLAGGVRGEWVGRDLFLDGNTFREGPSVEKRPFVAQAELGLGVRVRRVEVAYRAVWRGREYRTQGEAHRYGSITFTLLPR